MLRRQRVGLLSLFIPFSHNQLFICISMAASSFLLGCGSCSSCDSFIYKRSNILPLTLTDPIMSCGVGKHRINGGCIKGFITSFRFKCCCSDSHQSNLRMKANTVDTDVKRLLNGDGGAYHRGKVLPEKVVVAVDVDEVLGNFLSALNRFIADRYSANHTVSEYRVYEFFKIWNCSRDEADIRVHEFFKTSYFKTGIHPIPGAQQALQKLSRFCNLSIVTSRQNVIKDHTIEWIGKHYPGLFQGIYFGNHFALDGQSRPKSEICRSLGAKVLIDDNPRYAIDCAEVGIQVLLFDYQNLYPWCKIESVDQHPLVTKVHNWEEVEQQLFSWIK